MAIQRVVPLHDLKRDAQETLDRVSGPVALPGDGLDADETAAWMRIVISLIDKIEEAAA